MIQPTLPTLPTLPILPILPIATRTNQVGEAHNVCYPAIYSCLHALPLESDNIYIYGTMIYSNFCNRIYIYIYILLQELLSIQ